MLACILFSLEMEPVHFSKTLVNIYHITLHTSQKIAFFIIKKHSQADKTWPVQND
jgi:hypothetical protein